MSKMSSLYQELTDELIKLLKAGKLPPWRKSWSPDRNMGSPASILDSRPVGNLVTKKDYSGINFLILALASQRKGYGARWWATYKQWERIGAKVTKGEHGTGIVYYEPRTVVNDEGDEEDDLIIKWHTVFNIEQVEGEHLDRYRVGHPSAKLTKPEIDARYQKAEQMIAASGAKISFGGKEAYFNRKTDHIRIPLRKRFSDDGAYYAVVLHELIHWTGHRKRLNRLTSKRHGDDDYCFEELVAEIGACFTAARLGISIGERLPKHAAYLAHWLKGLSEDPKFIVRAATAASRASNYLLKIESPQRTQREKSKKQRNVKSLYIAGVDRA